MAKKLMVFALLFVLVALASANCQYSVQCPLHNAVAYMVGSPRYINRHYFAEYHCDALGQRGQAHNFLVECGD